MRGGGWRDVSSWDQHLPTGLKHTWSYQPAHVGDTNKNTTAPNCVPAFTFLLLVVIAETEMFPQFYMIA